MFGSINNVNDYYNIGDIFILPSLYEGLPVVGIEAQISGLFCIFSDKITREVALGDINCKFLSIKSPQIWAEEINNLNYKRQNNIDSIDYSQYLINKQAEDLCLIYEKLLRKERDKNEN